MKEEKSETTDRPWTADHQLIIDCSREALELARSQIEKLKHQLEGHPEVHPETIQHALNQLSKCIRIHHSMLLWKDNPHPQHSEFSAGMLYDPDGPRVLGGPRLG